MATSPPTASRQSRIDGIVSDLCKRLHVSDPQIRGIVEASSDGFGDARVTSFIPLLIERKVRDHLRERRALDAAADRDAAVIDVRERARTIAQLG